MLGRCAPCFPQSPRAALPHPDGALSECVALSRNADSNLIAASDVVSSTEHPEHRCGLAIAQALAPAYQCVASARMHASVR